MATTRIDNKVTLNSVAYAITGPVKQQPASDFQAGLRIGSPQYDNRTGAFILTLEDFSGGYGVLNADERKNEHMRVRYSTAETRFPKGMSLPGLVQTQTLASVGMDTIPIAKMRQWGDYLLIACGNKMFKLDSALTLTDITPTTPAFATTGGYTADLLIHDFNDGLFNNAPAVLWGMKGVTGGSEYWINALANPTALSWADQGSTPVEELHSMVSFDQKVLKIQGAVMKESNEGVVNTWGDLATVPFDQGTFMEVPLHSKFIGTHRVPFGPDFMPWLLLAGAGGYQGKIAPMDYWARQFKPLELNIGRISDAIMLDEGILMSNTYDIWKLLPGDPPSLNPLSLRKQQGLPPEMANAIVSGLGAIGGDPVIGLTNLTNRIWIMQHSGAGWHCRAEQAITTGIILDIATYEAPASLFGFRSAPYLCWVTWTGTVAQLHIIQETLGYGNPEQDPTYKYAASAFHETPWMYGGQEDLYGALFRFKVRGKLNGSEAIVVKYRLDEDDASGWTTLGTMDSNYEELSWGTNGVGIQFKSVRFRFELARGGTNTNTPLVRAIIILYDKKPVTRRSYLFTVDAARMITEQASGDVNPWSDFDATLTFQEILDALVTAKDNYTLIPFTYDDEETRYVKIIGVPSTESEIHDSKRRGQIQVQVSEIV